MVDERLDQVEIESDEGLRTFNLYGDTAEARHRLDNLVEGDLQIEFLGGRNGKQDIEGKAELTVLEEAENYTIAEIDYNQDSDNEEYIEGPESHGPSLVPSMPEAADSSTTENDTSSDEKPLLQTRGGENFMTDHAYNDQDESLAEMLEEHEHFSTQMVHGAARLERNGVDAIDALESTMEEYREDSMEKMEAVEDYLSHNKEEVLDVVNQVVSDVYDRIDDVDLSDRGDLTSQTQDTVYDILN